MRIKDLIVQLIIDCFVDSAYCVGYRCGSNDLWKECISEFNIVKPSFRYWYADPIPVCINNKTYVFVEKYDRLKS